MIRIPAMSSAALGALLALPALFAAGGMLLGQPLPSPDYIYFAPVVELPGGQPTFAPLLLDSSAGGSIQGGSLSVCVDAAVVTVTDIEMGLDLAQLAGGAGPDAFSPDIHPEGFILGWIVSYQGAFVLPPSAAFELIDVEFTGTGPVGASTPLPFCTTVSSVPVTSIVVVQGNTIYATTIPGSATITDPDPAFSLSLPPAIALDADFSAEVHLDAVFPVQGFRFGLAHDPLLVELLGAAPSALVASTGGGAGPALFLFDPAPVGGAGCTVQCVLDTVPPLEEFPAGSSHLVDLEYRTIAPDNALCAPALFEFRADLGAPAVPLTVQIAGSTIPADSAPASAPIGVEYPPPGGGVTIAVGSATGAPGGIGVVPVHLDSDQPVQAFSFGVVHDSPEFLLGAIAAGSALAALDCGSGPDYFQSSIPGTGTTGGTVVSLFDLTPPFDDRTLPAASALELVRLVYAIPANPTVASTAITLSAQVGSPPVAIEVTIDAQAVLPATLPGELTLGTEIVRGRCNGDAAVDIADAVILLATLFPPAGSPPASIGCPDACDANDDGALNIADAITLLGALFSGGSYPGPYACAPDPTGDLLPCAAPPCP